MGKSKKHDVTEPETNEAVAIEIPAALTTMSSKIRFLDSKGLSRGQIAKTLGIRYQWVRNVLVTPIKKAKVEIQTEAPAVNETPEEVKDEFQV